MLNLTASTVHVPVGVKGSLLVSSWSPSEKASKLQVDHLDKTTHTDYPEVISTIFVPWFKT